MAPNKEHAALNGPCVHSVYAIALAASGARYAEACDAARENGRPQSMENRSRNRDRVYESHLSAPRQSLSSATESRQG